MTWHPRISAGLIACSILFMVGRAHAVVTRHDVPDTAFVEDGAAPPFAAVGGLMADGALRGTGTLVRRRWVLTAAHVMSQAPVDAWEFAVGGQLYAVGEIVPHPCWAGDVDGGSDLALVRLVEAVDHVTAMRLHRAPDDPGTPVTILGYGFGARTADGRLAWDGALRSATNTVERHEIDAMVLVFDQPGSGRETSREGVAAFNDSGGPVLVETGDGWRLAGAHSFIVDRNGSGAVDYGDEHGATRVLPSLEWIDGTIDACPLDLDGSGAIDFGDLAAVLSAFGPCDPCPEDLDGSGFVDFADLMIVLGVWGPCG